MFTCNNGNGPPFVSRCASPSWRHWPCDEAPLAQSSVDFRFAAAVASFGMLLRESPHRGSATFGDVLELASGSKGSDPEGYRAEFLEMVRKARELGREEVVKKEKPARRASAPR